MVLWLGVLLQKMMNLSQGDVSGDQEAWPTSPHALLPTPLHPSQLLQSRRSASLSRGIARHAVLTEVAGAVGKHSYAVEEEVRGRLGTHL